MAAPVASSKNLMRVINTLNNLRNVFKNVPTKKKPEKSDEKKGEGDGTDGEITNGGGGDGTGEGKAERKTTDGTGEGKAERKTTDGTGEDKAERKTTAGTGEGKAERKTTTSSGYTLIQQMTKKVVLVVGFGSSIQSMFCALAAEASQVYLVDYRENAINEAIQVIKLYDWSEKVVVIHGRVEDLAIDDAVDIIISEWMSDMLLYGGMLGSFITATDRWLKPGGLVFPSHAKLYMAPVSYARFSEEKRVMFHVMANCDVESNHIYHHTLKNTLRNSAFARMYSEEIELQNVMALPQVVWSIDCTSISHEQIESDTISVFEFSHMQGPFNGFGFWFDVEFIIPTRRTLVLSTAPWHPPTKWKQTMFYFPDPIEVGIDQVINGVVTLIPQGVVHLEYIHDDIRHDKVAAMK